MCTWSSLPSGWRPRPRPPTSTPSRQDLAAAGIPAYAFTTLEMWAQSACRVVPKSGAYDAQVIAMLPKDVRGNDIDLTPAQAAALWTSAKTNIC